MDNYKDEIGRHLGRTMSGELMTPYEAPEKHDPSLLVAIPREIGRVREGIDLSRMRGYDIWHAYEFSFLQKPLGQPVTGTLKFKFRYDSPVMIESKSFKLYLNSFDFERFKHEYAVQDILSKELSEFTKSVVEVKFFKEDLTRRPTFLDLDIFAKLSIDRGTISDYYGNEPEITFDENPGLLKNVYPRGSNDIAVFHTANLRSACEITNQKDTGHCFIAASGPERWRDNELARYIFSMRNAQHFHENVTEIIFNTLLEKFQFDTLMVANIYNRRGGLDIHPIRATDPMVVHNLLPEYLNVSKNLRISSQT